jgi:DNA-binding HxlR family transcriptional regulator
MEVTALNNQVNERQERQQELTVLENSTVTRQILDRVGDKWSMLIIVNLGVQSLRFKELQRRSSGISQRMLTQTLRHLERDGLVWRKATPTVPLTVEYGLTELGESLLAPLTLLVEWVNGNRGEIVRARTGYDKSHGDTDTDTEIESESASPQTAGTIGAE